MTLRRRPAAFLHRIPHRIHRLAVVSVGSASYAGHPQPLAAREQVCRMDGNPEAAHSARGRSSAAESLSASVQAAPAAGPPHRGRGPDGACAGSFLRLPPGRRPRIPAEAERSAWSLRGAAEGEIPAAVAARPVFLPCADASPSNVRGARSFPADGREVCRAGDARRRLHA